MSLFKKRVRSTHALIIDIGSASVGAAIVEYKEKEKPLILYTSRHSVKFLKHPEPKHLLSLMREALDAVCLDTTVMALPTLVTRYKMKNYFDEIHVILAAPWYLSFSKNLSRTFKKPTIITQSIIENLVLEEQRKHSQKKDALELETKVMDIRLNGYLVKDFKGKSAHSVELYLFSSLIPHLVVETIEQTVSKYFHIDSLSYHSFSMAFFTVVRGMYVTADTYILLDIAGEVTEITTVDKDKVSYSSSFPIGARSVMRKLSREHKLSPAEAESRVRRVCIGDHCENIYLKTEEVLTHALKEWSDMFFESCVEGRVSMTDKHYVFFLADSNTGGMFTHALKNETLSRIIKSDRIVWIQDEDLAPFCTYSHLAVPDTFLAIGTLSTYMSRP